jgi:hypothetical protein
MLISGIHVQETCSLTFYLNLAPCVYFLTILKIFWYSVVELYVSFSKPHKPTTVQFIFHYTDTATEFVLNCAILTAPPNKWSHINMKLAQKFLSLHINLGIPAKIKVNN